MLTDTVFESKIKYVSKVLKNFFLITTIFVPLDIVFFYTVE